MPQPKRPPSQSRKPTAPKPATSGKPAPGKRAAPQPTPASEGAPAGGKFVAGEAGGDPGRREAGGAREEADGGREDALLASLGELRDLVTQSVVLTAELLQDAMDDAVKRGRLTTRDAQDLAQGLLTAGRRQAEDMRADFEQLLGRTQADRARRAAGGGGFPIPGFEDLTAGQVTSRLDDLTPAELRKVRDHERRHANRKSVLAAIERRLG